MALVSFKKGFDRDISPATISSWIKQTVILCYELSDQEAHTLHQVKTHDVRASAASKAFQSGVSLEQILSACHWKSHNTFTQFYLKDVAWADSELYHLGQWWLLSRSTKNPELEEICTYVNTFVYIVYKKTLTCFLREVYFYGTELIPLFPYLRAGLSKGGGSRVGPFNRSLLTDYGLKGFLTSGRPRLGEDWLVLFMSSSTSLVTYPPTKR